AGRDRLAALRRSLWPFRGAQPRDPAQRPERALAAALAATLRPDDLPTLPGARRRGRTAARAHGDRGRQLAAARRIGRAMGALAVGRVRVARVSGAAAALLVCADV